MKLLALCFVSLLSTASAANFSLNATPRTFTIQKGSSTQVTVSQGTAGFTGVVTYSLFSISNGLTAAITTVGNTATVVVSAAATANTGTDYVFLQGASNGSSVFLLLTANVVNPVVITPPPATGAITISSVLSGPSQTVNFTTLGSADWFGMGSYGATCVFGPCTPARKTGGTGLIGVSNPGVLDPNFYPFSANYTNVTWTDSSYVPNGTAVAVRDPVVTFQAFAATTARTLTFVAGIDNTGTFTTTLHMTDGKTPDVVDTQTFTAPGVRVFTVKFNAATAGHQLVVTMSHQANMVLYGAALSGNVQPETHYMTLTDNIQGFVNTAVGGDTILLPDGYTFVGHLILPTRVQTGLVDIKTNTTVLPNTRVKPGEPKATFTTPDASPVVQNDFNNADHTQRAARGYRFTAIEFTVNNPTSAINYGLIGFNLGPNPLITDLPSDITFDRCYIHGDGVTDYIRGIVGNANNITVSNSYIGGFVSANYEANAIFIWDSKGPINIINNYLESTGENVFIGGIGPEVGPAAIPTNGLIQHNYFFKQPSWRGGPYIVKNLLEFKNGYNFTIDSNVFENNWQAQQDGFAMLLGPREAQGGTTANHIDTITITNNLIEHVASGIVIGLYDDLARDANGNPIPPSQQLLVHDVKLVNNLFDDLGLKYANYSDGILMFGPPANTVIDHNSFNINENTQYDHGWFLPQNTASTPSNAVVTNNYFGAELYGDGRGGSDAVLTGGVFTGNDIANVFSNWYSSPYSSTNTFGASPIPAGVGADIVGLRSREPAIKSGNR